MFLLFCVKTECNSCLSKKDLVEQWKNIFIKQNYNSQHYNLITGLINM